LDILQRVQGDPGFVHRTGVTRSRDYRYLRIPLYVLTSFATRFACVSSMNTRRFEGMRGIWWPVTGTSMRPSLLEGDEVLLVPSGTRIRPGQVVVVRRDGGGLLLHRVVEHGPEGVVTRGDACQRCDAAAQPKAVLLRAVQRRRDGNVSPIPAPGWRATLRRLRSRLLRLLAPPDAAPGRYSRARP